METNGDHLTKILNRSHCWISPFKSANHVLEFLVCSKQWRHSPFITLFEHKQLSSGYTISLPSALPQLSSHSWTDVAFEIQT